MSLLLYHFCNQILYYLWIQKVFQSENYPFDLNSTGPINCGDSRKSFLSLKSRMPSFIEIEHSLEAQGDGSVHKELAT